MMTRMTPTERRTVRAEGTASTLYPQPTVEPITATAAWRRVMDCPAFCTCRGTNSFSENEKTP